MRRRRPQPPGPSKWLRRPPSSSAGGARARARFRRCSRLWPRIENRGARSRSIQQRERGHLGNPTLVEPSEKTQHHRVDVLGDRGGRVSLETVFDDEVRVLPAHELQQRALALRGSSGCVEQDAVPHVDPSLLSLMIETDGSGAVRHSEELEDIVQSDAAERAVDPAVGRSFPGSRCQRLEKAPVRHAIPVAAFLARSICRPYWSINPRLRKLTRSSFAKMRLRPSSSKSSR